MSQLPRIPNVGSSPSNSILATGKPNLIKRQKSPRVGIAERVLYFEESTKFRQHGDLPSVLNLRRSCNRRLEFFSASALQNPRLAAGFLRHGEKIPIKPSEAVSPV